MNFQLHNIPGVPTHYPRGPNNANPSVIDLCFSRGHITTHVDSWTINDESTSDHSIIGIILSRPLDSRPTEVRKDEWIHAWSRADWPLFQSNMISKGIDVSNLSSPDDTTRAIGILYSGIRDSISLAVPLVKKRVKFAPWWSHNLEWLSTRLKRARRRYALAPSEEASAKVQELKALWEKSVKKAKQRHWKKKLEQASRSSIWSITKRHTMAHLKAIPELDGSSDFEGKCEKLRHFLFPEPLTPLPYINDDFVTPLQDLTEAFDVVTATEVARALKSVNKNPAVGNDRLALLH
jgi:hypothetical protein